MNLVYTVAIGMDVREHAEKAWEHYCTQHNCDFKVIREPSRENMAPHWERYTVFERFPGYDNYIYCDADALVSWYCPDLFEALPDQKMLYVVKDLASLEWTWNSLQGYKDLFPETEVGWPEYFTTGFLKFDQSHRELFETILQFHEDNKEELNRRQYQTLRKGFDQTPVNYIVRQMQHDLYLLPEIFSLGHLHKKDVFQGGLFLTIPAYIWQFNGLPKEHLETIMKDIWNHVKNMYNHE